MRCPDCNKFVSLEFQDPEVDSLKVDDDGTITIDVRIVRACADCGMELKEASFQMEEMMDLANDEIAKHVNEDGETKHEFEIEEEGVEQIEQGGGRYQKSFFGASVTYTITCTCENGKADAGRWSHAGTLTDVIAASAMDEVV